MTHPTIIALVAAVVGLLATVFGCQRSGDALYADYAARLERLLDVDILRPDVQPLASWPPARDRLQAVPDVRVGVGEAWALRPCLEAALARRNSVLGKVMPPSQQLMHEHGFLRDANACLQDGAAAADPELAAAVESALAAKAGAVHRAAYNALMGDAQLAAFWRLSVPPLPPDSDRRMPAGEWQALAALLSDVLAGEAVPDGALEAVLGRMQGTVGLGEVVQAEWLATAWLDAISNAMQARLDRRPLCFEGRTTPTAQRLQTVLQQVFIGRIQVHLADLGRRRQAVAPPARAALQQVADWRTPAVQRWQAEVLGPAGAEQRFQQAARRHVQLWNTLLEQCGLQAGNREPVAPH